MKVVFFGTPEFAVPSLQRLLESTHEVVLVVSRPDKSVGRNRKMTSPPVIEEARRSGVPSVQPKKLKGPGFAEVVADARADGAVVVAYGRLIPESLLATPRYGFVNLHPSLLPRHRGPSPIQWALVCGDRRTGVSTMQLDEGMDTGPILLQKRVDIEPEENAVQLSRRLAEIGADLVVRTLDELERGRINPRPQPEDGVNVTPMLRRDFGRIDWSMHEPGTVLSADEGGIVVRCGRGTAARITELQREGRRRMPVDAFLIGEQVTRGELLG